MSSEFTVVSEDPETVKLVAVPFEASIATFTEDGLVMLELVDH